MSTYENLIGEEGLKIDVTLSISPEIYAKLFMVIALSMTIGMMVSQLLRNVVFKK